MDKTIRLILYFFAAVLALLLILQVALSLFGDEYAGNWLKEEIRKSSGNKYSLHYDDLDLGIGGSIQLHKLRLQADTTINTSTAASHDNTFTGTTDLLEIDGISLWGYFMFNRLDIGSITLKNPNFRLARNKVSPDNTAKNKQPFSTIDSTLYNAISNNFESLSVNEFSIHDGQFLIEDDDADQDSSIWGEGFNLRLENIEVDSLSAQSGRLFITDDISLDIGNFGHRLSNNFYTLSIQNLALSSDDKIFSTDSLRLIPRYSKYEFSRKKGKQIDRVTLTVPKINVQDIDVPRAINDRHFYAKSGSINKPQLKIFHDKSMPPGPPGTEDILPHVVFKKMKTKIKLDSLSVINGYVSYSEQRDKMNRAGTVSFEKLRATFTGISNFEDDLTDDHIAILNTSSQVMGTAELKAEFAFPMDDNSGRHTIKGNLGPTKAEAFNSASEYIAMVRFTDGMVYGLDFSMNLNSYGSEGTLTLDYENFKVSMLKQKGDKIEGQKSIKSFIANTFVVRDSNHEPPIDNVKIKFERDRKKSIFNLWWKSLMSGIKEQIGVF